MKGGEELDHFWSVRGAVVFFARLKIVERAKKTVANLKSFQRISALSGEHVSATDSSDMFAFFLDEAAGITNLRSMDLK